MACPFSPTWMSAAKSSAALMWIEPWNWLGSLEAKCITIFTWENSSTQKNRRSNYTCIPYTVSSCRVLKTYLIEEYMSHTSQQQYIPLTPRRLVSHFSHHYFHRWHWDFIRCGCSRVWQCLAPWGCFCGYTTFGGSPIGCMCFYLMGWGQIGEFASLFVGFPALIRHNDWWKFSCFKPCFWWIITFGVHKVPAFKTLQLYLIFVWLVSQPLQPVGFFLGGRESKLQRSWQDKILMQMTLGLQG